ncbi:MAG: hydrogenase nickel incorporation protein HypB [Parafannyhessea umbonata]|uniref:hydrogenase nickel incorporation protein HypB n=1 Tax=Parafannyhessea umbonata TaxID=604330 RepID=UPI0026F02EA5|nr:hydrogenase nickel incorporation protein HypB [Parafannyhessea umbonata]MCI6682155.1 hydrogenase nickel incorporation protein HypB [Parafannyhessea umbonata]MDY4015429.1 hydrogenase nickel incorporation protein HypB [Parafannyhessea umbonata]
MTDPIKVIEVKESVFANNDREAEALRARMHDAGTLMINLMSSPGAGKTTLLSATLRALADKMRIGVMEADVDSDVDAYTVQEAGAKAIQLHTGGMCHLDAAMTEQGLNQLGYQDQDLVVIENVGNLICPAEFDTGAGKKVMILSVPEGDDKPLKYPLMFEVSDLVLISKVDTLPYFDFDKQKLEQNVHLRNPNAKIIYLSAKTGEGMDEWLDWLRDAVRDWKA